MVGLLDEKFIKALASLDVDPVMVANSGCKFEYREIADVPIVSLKHPEDDNVFLCNVKNNSFSYEGKMYKNSSENDFRKMFSETSLHSDDIKDKTWAIIDGKDVYSVRDSDGTAVVIFDDKISVYAFDSGFGEKKVIHHDFENSESNKQIIEELISDSENLINKNKEEIELCVM